MHPNAQSNAQDRGGASQLSLCLCRAKSPYHHGHPWMWIRLECRCRCCASDSPENLQAMGQTIQPASWVLPQETLSLQQRLVNSLHRRQQRMALLLHPIVLLSIKHRVATAASCNSQLNKALQTEQSLAVVLHHPSFCHRAPR